ncbi:MAG TPA: hypothetical protein PKZ01_06830 [Candidatus Hydrogenedentes bacterium]|nr:hypothetical protein [Candidatus Hydrogenedentota bacterium]
MKEEDARVDDDYQLVLYVERDDGTYGPIQTGSYMKAHYFADYLAHRRSVQESELEKLCAGGISPIAYYMTWLGLSEGDLAARVRISVRRLRKHLRPECFAALDLPMLQRYAEVFGVPVANLFQVLTSDSPEMRLTQAKTANPLVVVTRAESFSAHE